MLYEIFLASLAAQVMPDVGSSVVALAPDIARVAPYTGGIIARGAWEETAQEEVIWYARDDKSRLTAINNGGAAYTNATTALVVDDSKVFGVGSVVECRATGEFLLVTAIDDATNTITVRRGHGAGGGGGAAAHANSVADDAVLEHIGVAAAPGGDKLPERWLADSQRTNICQFFREQANEDGRKKATKLLVADSYFAGQIAARTRKFYIDLEMSSLFGVYSKTATDANGKRVTTQRGVANSANQVTIGGTMNMATWNGHTRTVFATGSEERVGYFGIEALDYVLALYGGKDWREESGDKVGKVVRTITCQGGIIHCVPHLGFKGSRAKDFLLLDMLGAQHKLRNMGAGRFTDITGNEFDGKIQLVKNRQLPSEDLNSVEIMADCCVEGGEQSFNYYFKNLTGNA